MLLILVCLSLVGAGVAGLFYFILYGRTCCYLFVDLSTIVGVFGNVGDSFYVNRVLISRRYSGGGEVAMGGKLPCPV